MSAVATPDLCIEEFEAGAVDACAFNHEAHIYVAWLYLERYPLCDAINGFTRALRRLTIQLGVPGKYHETISWFFLLLIQERRTTATISDWFAFRRENTDLFSRDDNILKRYYSDNLLSSERAKRSFVLPDRLAN